VRVCTQGRWFVGLAVVNLGYVANAWVYLIDRRVLLFSLKARKKEMGRGGRERKKPLTQPKGRAQSPSAQSTGHWFLWALVCIMHL